jgi:hypothetical protein
MALWIMPEHVIDASSSEEAWRVENILNKMEKSPFAMYPMEGLRYWVTEWDGVINRVRVLDVNLIEVTFQYEDGLTHKVDAPHFCFDLRARGA